MHVCALFKDAGLCKVDLPGDQLACMQDRPDALFIGLPPSRHGSIDDPKADIELQLAKVSKFQHLVSFQCRRHCSSWY